MYMGILPTCMPVIMYMACSWRQEEGNKSHGTRITGVACHVGAP